MSFTTPVLVEIGCFGECSTSFMRPQPSGRKSRLSLSSRNIRRRAAHVRCSSKVWHSWLSGPFHASLGSRITSRRTPQGLGRQRVSWCHSPFVGLDASAPPAESLSAPKNFFAKMSFTQRLPPLWDRTIFGQVFVRGAMNKISKWKVPPTRGSIAR